MPLIFICPILSRCECGIKRFYAGRHFGKKTTHFVLNLLQVIVRGRVHGGLSHRHTPEFFKCQDSLHRLGKTNSSIKEPIDFSWIIDFLAGRFVTQYVSYLKEADEISSQGVVIFNDRLSGSLLDVGFPPVYLRLKKRADGLSEQGVEVCDDLAERVYRETVSKNVTEGNCSSLNISHQSEVYFDLLRKLDGPVREFSIVIYKAGDILPCKDLQKSNDAN